MTPAKPYDHLIRLDSIASSPANSFAFHFLGRVMLCRTLSDVHLTKEKKENARK
jgi:hypothetical protein